MDEKKSVEELTGELTALRQQLAELQTATAACYQKEQALIETLDQIERAKQEWEITADSLPQLICLLDNEGRVIRANRVVESWGLGHVTEVKGQKVEHLLQPMPGASGGSWAAFLEQAWRHLAEGHSSEGEIEDTSLKRHFQVQVQPISPRTGRQSKATDSYAAIIIHDITERKQAERLKNEFLNNISQELHTPLTSIIGYSQIMLTGMEGELSTKILEDVQAIHENGQQLLTLINEILDMAEIEVGSLALSAEQIEIEPLLQQIKTNHSALLGQKPVEIKVKVEADIPALKADKMRLGQILNHLVGNAIRFTQQGQVNMHAFRENGWLCIQVADTGIGISQENLETIFEKFRQVDGSLSRRVKGMGLGLTIARHLVKLHGGNIDVQSQLGQGTVVTVRLPLST